MKTNTTNTTSADNITEKTAPLLSVGNFGVHLTETPKGGFKFTGTVPEDFRNTKAFETYDDGVSAFVTWYAEQDADFQREHIGDLRNDVFVQAMEAIYN
jgi:hypothetical protein